MVELVAKRASFFHDDIGDVEGRIITIHRIRDEAS